MDARISYVLTFIPWASQVLQVGSAPLHFVFLVSGQLCGIPWAQVSPTPADGAGTTNVFVSTSICLHVWCKRWDWWCFHCAKHEAKKRARSKKGINFMGWIPHITCKNCIEANARGNMVALPHCNTQVYIDRKATISMDICGNKASHDDNCLIPFKWSPSKYLLVVKIWN